MAKERSAGIPARIHIGVDVGGTHTDLILAMNSSLHRSKAFTTHDDYSRGVFDALEISARDQMLEPSDLLSRADSMFVNGTTIVTNVLTEFRGAKVGVLITRGFKDTFRFARGARRRDYDDHKQLNPPDVVQRDCIEEIDERIDGAGNVVTPLDEAQVRAAVHRLRAKGVEGIAICYLWSFRNPVHEKRTEEIVRREFPEAFVTVSSEIHPIIREFERWMTAVFNCLCYKATTRYLHKLNSRLREGGYKGTLTFFQGIGGSISLETAEKFPILLLASGPAGGVTGANFIAGKMGVSSILTGDMGGTSFDASLLEDRKVTISKSVAFDELETGIDIVDVISVGAGGGSIAWTDSRGVPQVGPHSMGSEPGPVCYGRGGTEATVTDAMVVMDVIDVNNYLGGRYRLDVDAARSAIESKLGRRFGWSAERAAAAIHDLVVINMANALREVSVERGYDPRHFAMFAYGGTLPMFAVQICREIGIKQVIIPNNSSVFSAFGLLTADYVRRYSRTVDWVLSDSEGYRRINAVADELVEAALEDARKEGFGRESVQIVRSGDFRFLGQVYEVNMRLPDRELTDDDGTRMAQEFPEEYERAYGKGTSWKGSPVVLLNYSVKVVGPRMKPELRRGELSTEDSAKALKSNRPVYMPDLKERRTIPVYDDVRLLPGMTVTGPAIIDESDTTVYVPSGATCRRDEWFNLILET
jgi:N-methylhydantoinase A